METQPVAVEVVNTDIIHELCSRGLNVDVCTSLGKTPLHYSAQIAWKKSYLSDHAKFLQSIATLLSLGADVNAQDNREQTPLFYAAATDGSTEAINLLLDAGADINALDASGQNALFWADGNGVFELLLQRGANHLFRNKRGGTALKCAQFAGIHVQKIKLLESLEA